MGRNRDRNVLGMLLLQEVFKRKKKKKIYEGEKTPRSYRNDLFYGKGSSFERKYALFIVFIVP